MKITLLMTGNEVMAGDIIDSNSAKIAHLLKEFGYQIYKKVAVGDELPLLVDSILALSRESDVLIMNGGLGPTRDDFTSQAMADAAEVELEENRIAREHLEAIAAARGMVLNESNLKQIYLPADCVPIPNPRGSALGMQMEINGCQVYCTSGVPSEMDTMIAESILPDIRNRFPAGEMDTLKLMTFGLGESSLQTSVLNLFGPEALDGSDGIELGFRASIPYVELKLERKSEGDKDIQLDWAEKLKRLFPGYILNGPDLPQSVSQLLKEQGKTLTLAESCTGGLIASQITAIPGSSEIFQAGFVVYADEIKKKVLGVPEDVLEKYGAVSASSVLHMAEGALKISGADMAIAVSGIAGPDGGTEEKPVGTVWIAWGAVGDLQAREFRIRGPRERFQKVTAAAALDLVRRQLQGIELLPQYHFDGLKK